MAVWVHDLMVDVVGDDHDAAVAWWAEALGGLPRPVGGPYTHLDGVRSRVGLHVQRVDAGPGGYHLDVAADDVDAEVERLVALGAAVVDDSRGSVVLTDPVGLPFCVVTGEPDEQLSDARDALHLRVLMLDVPAAMAGDEAAFWAAALGGQAVPVGDHYPAYTWVRPVAGAGGPINLAVQSLDVGGPRMHVDLHCPDPPARDAAVARLVGRGATIVDRTDHWVVLRAPGGHLACVVPDPPAET